MTQVEVLLRDLEVSVPSAVAADKRLTSRAIRVELKNLGNCITSARIAFIDPTSTPARKRAVMSSIASQRKVLKDVIAVARKQELPTAFENFDQKANQLFSILSTVLKNTKEMQAGVTRNIL